MVALSLINPNTLFHPNNPDEPNNFVNLITLIIFTEFVLPPLDRNFYFCCMNNRVPVSKIIELIRIY